MEPALTPLAYWQLGRGESEVIEYARRNPGTRALLDDKDARNIAAALQILVIGTLGILAKSLQHGDVASFKSHGEPLEGCWFIQKLTAQVENL